MKKFLLTLCLLMGCATLQAAIATVDGIEWIYQVTNGEAQIMSNYYSGELVIPSSLDGYPVTSIGNSAFHACKHLVSVFRENVFVMFIIYELRFVRSSERNTLRL